MSETVNTALAICGGVAAVGNGLVFLTAGLAKLRNRRVFPGVVANYRLLPEKLIGPVATALPVAEVLIGAALLGGVWLAVVPASALLIAFAAAMAVNIGRGRAHIDCGCGRSELRQPLSRTLVLRNLVLAALLIPALFALPLFGSLEWGLSLAGGLALYLMTLLVNALAGLAAGPLAVERNSR
ncbi:MAG: methylamine utilization protein MauE [Novosphingobium sp. 28-62-57]|uniref:MauE/DoxX family redox-associated membrane protein n=1 Tax=unclassified Novosphingobium TaxID=2644732 RepID=UPI000BD06EA6|nr:MULTISPECIES: MauE/DoxX family redox-associated membrane protein [unclassified Novosphingobium]OYW49001.1 MAG: methylamine utilization protein MauE [Novosphingobium sp. 12-62-10]OYZ09532.1 MAG: methylamine utilization protein MauE [Novosphingobium sp. 28-62-57]